MNKDINNKKNIHFIIMLIAIWGLYCILFDKIQYKASIIFSIIYIGAFILVNKEKKYYLILFALPFASIFKLSNSTPSVLIILYVIYIINGIRTNKIKMISYIAIIGLAINQIISIFTYDANIVNIISFIVNILFIMVCMSNFMNLDNQSKERVLKTSSILLAISLIFSIIVTDMMPQIPYIILRDKQTLLMSINRFCGLNGDPNYYSQLILVSIPILYGNIIEERNLLYKVGQCFLCIFLVINGFRSVSKSYALTIVILLIMLLIYTLKETLSKKVSYLKVVLIFIVIIISVIGLKYFIFGKIIPLIESRTDAGDFFTGRVQIWSEYIKLLKVNPLIILMGVGFGNEATVLSKYFGINKAPHNIYIEIITTIGISGVCLIMVLIKDLLKNIKEIFSNVRSLYIIMFLITGIGLSLSSNDAMYILFPLSTLIIRKN